MHPVLFALVSAASVCPLALVSHFRYSAPLLEEEEEQDGVEALHIYASSHGQSLRQPAVQLTYAP